MHKMLIKFSTLQAKLIYIKLTKKL